MNKNQEHTLNLLEKLLKNEPSKKDPSINKQFFRKPEYLTSATKDISMMDTKKLKESWTNDWAFHIPFQFADALDIALADRMKPFDVVTPEGEKKVETRKIKYWTQGRGFDFPKGMTIYDTSKAYEMPWSEALQHIQTVLMITAANPAEANTENRGSVTFDIYTPNESRSAVVKVKTLTMSQDEFLYALITGKGRTADAQRVRAEIEAALK